MCSGAEKALIDSIIDIGAQTAADVDYKVLHSKLSLIKYIGIS